MLQSTETLNHTSPLWKPKQIWNAIVCCFNDHKVPLSAPQARPQETHWLVTCERCGKVTRV